MKNKFRIIFVLVLFIFGCSNTEKNPKHIKNIVLKESEDVEVLSRFVSDLEYIELKYPSDSLIGPIENLKLLDNEIIIKQRQGNEVKYFRFTRDGNFLNEIGNSDVSGKPKMPHDILIYNGQFAIWDKEGVQVFSKSGDYLKELFQNQSTGNSFFYSNSNFYLFHELNDPGYLSKHGDDGKLLKIYKPNNLQVDDLGYSRVIEFAPDSFHLFSPINDTVFSYSENHLTPEYIVQGENHPTMVNVLKEINSLDQTEKLKYLHSNKHWVIKRYLENRDFIFVVYRLASDSFYLIIRKSDWVPTYFGQVINDIDGGIWDYPMYLSDDNELYIPLGTYQIAGHKMLNKKRFDFEKVMKKNQENHSPVIMKCRLK